LLTMTINYFKNCIINIIIISKALS
jgi:hypothetical protein